MARANESREGLTLWGDECLFKCDAFVPWEDWLTDTNQAVTIAHRGWNMRDFIPPWLSLLRCPSQSLEGFEEERFDVVWLQPSRFGPFHILPHALHAARIHGVVNERSFLQQILQLGLVERIGHHSCKPGLDLWALTVPDCLNEEIAEWLTFELHLAQHVEHLTAECLPCLVELFQQCQVDIALARLLRDQIPEVADLGLPDAVDAPKSLFETVGVPGQVVVDHEVGPLKINTFTGRIGGEEYLHLGVMLEGFLCLHALRAAQATVNHDDGLSTAEQRGDAVLQVVQRVAVLGEEHEFLPGRWGGSRHATGPIGGRLFCDMIRNYCRREDFPDQLSQFAPLLIFTAAADCKGQRLQVLELRDLCLQFLNVARGCSLVENLFLSSLNLVVWCFFEIRDIILIECRAIGHHGRCGGSALEQFHLAQAFL